MTEENARGQQRYDEYAETKRLCRALEMLNDYMIIKAIGSLCVLRRGKASKSLMQVSYTR